MAKDRLTVLSWGDFLPLLNRFWQNSSILHDFWASSNCWTHLASEQRFWSPDTTSDIGILYLTIFSLSIAVPFFGDSYSKIAVFLDWFAFVVEVWKLTALWKFACLRSILFTSHYKLIQFGSYHVFTQNLGREFRSAHALFYVGREQLLL
jgi:hypothetical protein